MCCPQRIQWPERETLWSLPLTDDTNKFLELQLHSPRGKGGWCYSAVNGGSISFTSVRTACRTSYCTGQNIDTGCYSIGTGVLYPGVKWPRRKSEHSIQYYAYGYTSTVARAFTWPHRSLSFQTESHHTVYRIHCALYRMSTTQSLTINRSQNLTVKTPHKSYPHHKWVAL